MADVQQARPRRITWPPRALFRQGWPSRVKALNHATRMIRCRGWRAATIISSSLCSSATLTSANHACSASTQAMSSRRDRRLLSASTSGCTGSRSVPAAAVRARGSFIASSSGPSGCFLPRVVRPWSQSPPIGRHGVASRSGWLHASHPIFAASHSACRPPARCGSAGNVVLALC